MDDRLYKCEIFFTAGWAERTPTHCVTSEASHESTVEQLSWGSCVKFVHRLKDGKKSTFLFSHTRKLKNVLRGMDVLIQL